MGNAKWKSIEIDIEVFEFLQQKATPLIDSANDVLRRLLLKDKGEPRTPRARTMRIELVSGGPLVTSETFAKNLLVQKFGAGFETVSGCSYLFESADSLVYFQNYNKSDPVLWYRIHKRPRAFLKLSNKNTWLVFTNPSERSAYVLPVSAVEKAADSSGWSRDYFELHIDTRDNRWSELDWDLSRYRINSK
jgi:hypothetical protein